MLFSKKRRLLDILAGGGEFSRRTESVLFWLVALNSCVVSLRIARTNTLSTTSIPETLLISRDPHDNDNIMTVVLEHRIRDNHAGTHLSRRWSRASDLGFHKSMAIKRGRAALYETRSPETAERLQTIADKHENFDGVVVDDGGGGSGGDGGGGGCGGNAGDDDGGGRRDRRPCSNHSRYYR